MLPKDVIDEWQRRRRWESSDDCEQDLLLEAILHEAAAAGLFAPMAMIGGTCIHKLHAPTPQRYSEDLDFAWLGDGSPDRTLAGIAAACRPLGFARIDVVDSTESAFPKVLFYFEHESAEPGKIKLEANTRMSGALAGGTVDRPLVTRSRGTTTESLIPSAPLGALAGMKIVAGSSRSKTRDFYDLWLLMNDLGVEREEAMSWAQKLGGPQWKPARRHRFVGRKSRDPKFWDDLKHQIPGADPTDQAIQEMKDLMQGMLRDLQTPASGPASSGPNGHTKR